MRASCVIHQFVVQQKDARRGDASVAERSVAHSPKWRGLIAPSIHNCLHAISHLPPAYMIYSLNAEVLDTVVMHNLARNEPLSRRIYSAIECRQVDATFRYNMGMVPNSEELVRQSMVGQVRGAPAGKRRHWPRPGAPPHASNYS
ncbi:unnamed protein product [Spodoptera exigua]|nr:unnamed protein product [Spodoptera exigua]